MMAIMETMGRSKRPRRSFTKQFKVEVVELVASEGTPWRAWLATLA